MTTELGRVGAGGRLAAARILVVDDEPANTLILERLLTQAGYGAVRASNDPRRALELYESFEPDIVLLDLHMPHVDGYQVLGQIAGPDRSAVRPPVLVLTADVTRAARERALGLGAADFLTKPLDHLEVLLRIRNHLATRFVELDLVEANRDLELRVSERTNELRASLDRLRETMEARRLLASRLVTAQEEERRRVAADIHDDTVQRMVAVGIRLELLARRLTDPDQRTEMDRLRATVAETLSGLRHLLFDLLPPALEREGLEATLRQHLERMQADGGPTWTVVNDSSSELTHDRRVVLFRIAQEALANVRKHAAASLVTVALADDGGGIRLEVRDDGRGFALDEHATLPGHLGLPAIQERAELAGGWCRIESALAAGTNVTAWVPFEAELRTEVDLGD
jgi:signal transduction histidine kinase